MSENNETVAELLREWRDEGEHIQCSMCRAAVGYDFCVSNECPDAWGALADRVEAEIAEARDLSAREGMAIIAEAEGWPPLHDGEGVTEWMARCWLSRPLYEDGEPVQMGDRYLMANGSHDTVSSLSYSKGSVDYVSINGRRRMLSERVKRPATEVMAEQFRLDFKAGAERRIAYGMELMDVIHAAETALRMEFADHEVETLHGCVERKNRERGYYGE